MNTLKLVAKLKEDEKVCMICNIISAIFLGLTPIVLPFFIIAIA
jgi:hypothetical protein|tara:strand:- start:314 stop:445 length:132 start_codon:yes stop_codon:yes gene_type:complete